jgi:tRNA(His) 5'-end guanylyltransferase
MDTSDLGKRMKEYEDAQKTHLTRRMPVMIRVDGNAFHTFTRGMNRPFDKILNETMQETMKYMCENISGCVLGYTQSDEITLLLIDYKSKTQDAWFGYVRRKVETIAASMATMAFNNAFADILTKYMTEDISKCKSSEDAEKIHRYYLKYLRKCGKAMFDARAWNMPEFEVINEFIWRQNDCVRNSIQSVGRAYFSDKELYKKNKNQIMDMLMLEKKVNWNDFPTYLKRGSCCIKIPTVFNEGTPDEFIRNKWVIDYEIPNFTQNRAYVTDAFLINHNNQK